MVQLTTAATVTVAVLLAASAYAEPAAKIEGTGIDTSARSKHGHAHGAKHHHHATPSRRDLDDVEELDARFFRKIARKIFGRDLSSLETELEARDPTWHNWVGNGNMRRELQDPEELEARFIRRITRKIFGRELDELDARDFEDGEELEARHEHGHHHLHEHVKRALEEMSDEELQARAPFFRRIARKIFGRDLDYEELEARLRPGQVKRSLPGHYITKLKGRGLEQDLEARGLMRPGRRPVGWRGALPRPRELEVEDSVAARSLEELD
ncbi:hypothetical protein H1R20_g2047, partial [Candolleomyces eurysporus]